MVTRRDEIMWQREAVSRPVESKKMLLVVTLNGCPVVVVVCSPLSFKDLASDHLDGGCGESQVRYPGKLNELGKEPPNVWPDKFVGSGSL
jgi:hypothetical protein